VLVLGHAVRGSQLGATTPTRLEALLLGDELQVPENSSPNDLSGAGNVRGNSAWDTPAEGAGGVHFTQACEELLHAAAEVSAADIAALRAENAALRRENGAVREENGAVREENAALRAICLAVQEKEHVLPVRGAGERTHWDDDGSDQQPLGSQQSQQIARQQNPKREEPGAQVPARANVSTRKLQAHVSTASACNSEVHHLTCATSAASEPFNKMSPGNHITVKCPDAPCSEISQHTQASIADEIAVELVVGGQDGVYEESSPICLAAMHNQGSREHSGQYIITIRDSHEDFVGLVQNDVTSGDNSAGGWRSYSLEADDCLGFFDICKGQIIEVDNGRIGTGAQEDFGAFYQDDQDCASTIVAPLGQTITLTFLRFDVETTYDSVTVFDGSFDNITQPIPLSGFDIPAPITSTTNAMLIKFFADDSVTWQGWAAKWTFHEVGGPILTDSGQSDSHAEDISENSRLAHDYKLETEFLAQFLLSRPWTVVAFDWRKLDKIETSLEIQLPFDFPLYSSIKRINETVIASCAGYLAFSDGVTRAGKLPTHPFDAIPSPATHTVVAPFWVGVEDHLEHTCSIHSSVLDWKGVTELVIEWGPNPVANGNAVTRFQTILAPSGEIRFQWLEVPAGQNALIGVQSSHGEIGIELSNDAGYVVNRSAISVSTKFSMISRGKPVSTSRSCGGFPPLVVDGNSGGNNICALSYQFLPASRIGTQNLFLGPKKYSLREITTFCASYIKFWAPEQVLAFPYRSDGRSHWATRLGGLNGQQWRPSDADQRAGILFDPGHQDHIRKRENQH
jgi:hypothetical protein